MRQLQFRFIPNDCTVHSVMVFADKWSVDNGIVHADNSDGSPVASFYLDDGSVEIVSNDYIDNRDRTITRVTVTGILETY